MKGTDRMQHCAGKTACKSKWFYFSKKKWASNSKSIKSAIF